MLGFLGMLFVVFLGAFTTLGCIGLWQSKREAKKGRAPSEEEAALSQKTVDNVLDLNDRFNRARYMDEDGN